MARMRDGALNLLVFILVVAAGAYVMVTEIVRRR